MTKPKNIKIGHTYQFSKSGNLVKTISWHAGKWWTVERIDGSSARKQMLVHERALSPIDSKVTV